MNPNFLDRRGPIKTSATILLIDDDLGDRELTRRALRSAGSDALLLCVANGEEALEYLTRKGAYSARDAAPRPDIILLDINMPRLDGREFQRQARQIQALACIPIVTLTTSNDARDIADMYNLGASSFVTKPRSLEQFIEVTRSLIQYWFETVSLPQPR